MTVTAFVCWRKKAPSPRTEFWPRVAFAGTVTMTLALPVFDVVIVATVTQLPLTRQRMRTASCLPYPRSETFTAPPRETCAGLTEMRGATSNPIETIALPEAKITVLAAPPSVAGTTNEPAAAPLLSAITAPRFTTLPPGRRQVIEIVDPGRKCSTVKLTPALTVARVVDRAAVGGPGMVTVTALVCCARC